MSRAKVALLGFLVTAVLAVTLIGVFFWQWKQDRLERSEEIAQETEKNQVDLEELDRQLSSSSESSQETATNSRATSDSESMSISKSSSTSSGSAMEVVKTGEFESYQDYKPEGKVRILKGEEEVIIEFQEGFKFAPESVPDPFVYLAPEPEQKNTKGAVLVSDLQKLSGRQAYRVSLDTYRQVDGQVMIWCEALGVYMGGASLSSAEEG